MTSRLGTKTLRSTVVLLMLGLLVGACDKEKSSSGAQGPVIEVAAKWEGDEQAAFKDVLKKFEEQYKVTVVYVPMGDDLSPALKKRIAMGSAPDVAIMPQRGLMSDFVQRKELQPIEDVVGRLVDQNYAPAWRQLGSVNGTLYGVWYRVTNKSTVWYSTSALSAAGAIPPRTWDELKNVAQMIKATGRYEPFAVAGADGWPLTDWFENVYLGSAGPEKYDQLARCEIPWTDQSVRRALMILGEVLRSDWLVGGAAGSLGTNFGNSVLQVFGDPTSAAMVYEGDFVAQNIANETRSRVGVDAKYFDFPSISGSRPPVMVGGDVAVLFKKSRAAEDLIRFLATPEAASPWVARGGFISPNQALDRAFYRDETGRQLADAVIQRTVRYDLSDDLPPAFAGTPRQGMWKILQDFLRNPANVEAITQQLEVGASVACGR